MNKSITALKLIGRPPLAPEKKLVVATIRLTPEQVLKVKKLGAAELRRLIDSWEVGGKH